MYSAWFKVAISAVDLTGTVPHRSRRCGPESGEPRETLHWGLKKCWKITTNFTKKCKHQNWCI